MDPWWARSVRACWCSWASVTTTTRRPRPPLADKTVDLRVFKDEAGLTNRSLIDVGGEVLAIGQFTLFADVRKGRRPSFLGAATPDQGRALYDAYADAVAARGVRVARGEFGAEMEVELVNDGPMTVWLEWVPGQGFV